MVQFFKTTNMPKKTKIPKTTKVTVVCGVCFEFRAQPDDYSPQTSSPRYSFVKQLNCGFANRQS